MTFFLVVLVMLVFFVFFFFFSSRRRHTRSYGDWSSDVCSSDLFFFESKTAALRFKKELESLGKKVQLFALTEITDERLRNLKGIDAFIQVARSEERRVGKECRCRWSTDDEKKKQRRKRVYIWKY